jgi:hypothetical protein
MGNRPDHAFSYKFRGLNGSAMPGQNRIKGFGCLDQLNTVLTRGSG